jgi:hypothetical protein
MSIFPFINGDNGLLESFSNNLPLYKECAWDFIKDEAIFIDGNPKIVQGNEALKVWIYKAIKTNRYQYEIYTWDYGCEIETLIGKGFQIGFIKSETKRYVEEALIINPYITKINKIKVDFNKDVLSVEVDLETIYGRVNMYV